MTNTLAYYIMELITSVKSFIVQAPFALKLLALMFRCHCRRRYCMAPVKCRSTKPPDKSHKTFFPSPSSFGKIS
jgi:hypothetical protein